MRKHWTLWPAAALILLLGLSAPPTLGNEPLDPFLLPHQGSAPQAAQDAEQAPDEPEKIYGKPQNITESVAIYVFLGWLWLSILVLIYLIQLKIRECDRLDNFDYYLTGDPKKPES